MKKSNRWLFAAIFAAGGMLLHPLAQAHAEAKIKVVATLSTFADLVQKIGGDRVKVHTVASPRFNPHFIEPKPSDVLRTSQADLFVHAGLDLEAWRAPLVEAAANIKILPGGEGDLDLSQGITLLQQPTQPLSRAQGDIHLFGNPHYWLNPENGAIMAKAIAAKLSAMDSSHTAEYEANLAKFLARLDEKIPEWKAQVSSDKGKEAIAYHNEWVYLADFAGVKIDQFLEPKPGIPPTPKHLAFLEGYVKKHGIPAIFQATFYSKDAARVLEKRTGIKLYLLCVNVGEIPEAGDFFSFFDYNIGTIAKAFAQ